MVTTFGAENLSTKALQGTLSKLGHVKLSAYADERMQGWYEKDSKGKSTTGGKKGPAVRTHHPEILVLQEKLNNILKLRNKRQVHADKLPNYQKVTLGPADLRRPGFNVPDSQRDGDKPVILHFGAQSFAMEDAISKLPKLMYSGFMLDLYYDMDKGQTNLGDEATEQAALEKFVTSFPNSTTATYWVGQIFCSFQQMEWVYDCLSKVCNLGVERHFWYKQGQQASVQATRATNVVEVFLVGFFGPKDVTSRASHQADFTHDGDKRENFHSFYKVHKPYVYNNEVRLNSFFLF